MPTYHRAHFWAGASSTQQSEGMNALRKIHVSRQNTRYEFVVIYDKILARQRKNEIQAYHKTSEKRPILKTPCPIKDQMSQVYTIYVFYKFQDERHNNFILNAC